MIEFSQEHSAAWLELMQAYQQYRVAIFHWSKEVDTVKYKDLFIELGEPIDSKARDIHKRLLVTDFLRSTEMWDEKAIVLIHEELTEVALAEQEEAAAWARIALEKIKSRLERLSVADKIDIIAAKEAKKEKPDCVVFHNGCLLLRGLKCKERFSQFFKRYKDMIYAASGLDEKDLEDMKNSMLQDE